MRYIKNVSLRLLNSAGEAFLQDPTAVMSVDPQSNVADVMLGVVESKKYSRKCHHVVEYCMSICCT